MIALFGRSEVSVAGIATILDIEKIPYRHVDAPERQPDELLVVADPNLNAADIASLPFGPTLVLHGGAGFVRRVLGAETVESRNRPCRIGLDEQFWPLSVRRVARKFEKSHLRVPAAPTCETPGLPRGAVLARFGSAAFASEAPAIVRTGHIVWSAIDLGTAFACLLSESYRPQSELSEAARLGTRGGTAETLYYMLPEFVREDLRRRVYGALNRRIGGDPDGTSDYPIDATGWLLVELVKRLITLAGGSLLRLERWPAPWKSAATLTHDIEPRPYAYQEGLQRLLARCARSGAPHAFSLVARPAVSHLSPSLAAKLSAYEIICHGLEHRGENVANRAELLNTLRTARAELSQLLGRRIAGYRSPRLDRSAALAWALDRALFDYDSSYPDVDRENMQHFGAGVRLNLPFRAPVPGDDGHLRPSRCLELPLTAPDCIQPLFAGTTLSQLRADVAAKAAFVRASGGFYMALVHGGVFGLRDSAVREEHLDFVSRQLCHADTWLATVPEIVAWWRGREKLRISVAHGAAIVRNEGEQSVRGVRLVAEVENGSIDMALPPLEPGGQALLALPAMSATVAA